ncbi:MAG: hypothetical protein NZ653_07870 [Anaerolineae bacterium]|nr:hypothetical protein [Anaerolineae bacterium]
MATLPETHEESLAFSLLIIRLCNCLNCNLGSYKASLGCVTCAKRAVIGFKESDEALLKLFEQARREVAEFLASVPEDELLCESD